VTDVILPPSFGLRERETTTGSLRFFGIWLGTVDTNSSEVVAGMNASWF
jgi:hypothetical protein